MGTRHLGKLAFTFNVEVSNNSGATTFITTTLSLTALSMTILSLM